MTVMTIQNISNRGGLPENPCIVTKLAIKNTRSNKFFKKQQKITN